MPPLAATLVDPLNFIMLVIMASPPVPAPVVLAAGIGPSIITAHACPAAAPPGFVTLPSALPSALCEPRDLRHKY